ncbi:general secretion pathway protein D [Thioflavicoccus mobilis 8321]|uniref:General secretion pathway protein D n=1 Tax=Thioflavicoccus mobilis 8321 TaxID=765912 RepID=L0GSG2_9GAMM|nr:type II secretion system secretin GspD [Thioflavicoccus mobilis]AGA88931.1 general secretion pathway protein D [Thioflavicoccus mobilis 8321]
MHRDVSSSPPKSRAVLWTLFGTFVTTATVGLSGCEPGDWDPTLRVSDQKGHMIGDELDNEPSAVTSALRSEGGISVGGAGGPQVKSSIDRGTGTFVGTIDRPDVDTTPGDVTLNFDGTDIREVVKVILGDLLQVNYVIHPAVQGTVSLQTGRPLRRDLLVPTLETLLRMNDAALVEKAGRYEVVPLTNAIQGNVVSQLGESSRALPEGYSVQIVPLQYIGAEEMSRILQPLVPEGSIVRVDTVRNLLIIAATSPQLGNVLDTIGAFDVNWMAGLSVGFFPLDYAKAADVAKQLEGLLADGEDGNPFKGLFRFVPVESANSLLVISPQEKYLTQVQGWIERLDIAEAAGDGAQRLFVYRVKHGDAEALADILTKLFSGDSRSSRRQVGGVAPGLRTATLESDGAGDSLGSKDSSRSSAMASNIALSSAVSIVADVVNNSLLIRSTPRDYKSLLDALKQLDIVPLQVLVEATIVEITLAGSLEYGVQWQIFGKIGNYKQDFSLDGTLDNSQQSGINKSFPGFNWAVIASPDKIRATLSALAGDNLVNVLSSPSVMVMDNQTAKMQVGQEVPVVTTEQQGTSSDDRIVNQIEYKDTGVMLSVKPRVTPGGLVQMEIEQEVSSVVDQSADSGVASPTFRTRNITSSVAVRSNQAVVLGGLIQDQRERGKQGIPGLYRIPIVGNLFGQTRKSADRTELVVILTPRVIASDQDIESVTGEFRNKLKGLDLGASASPKGKG